MHTQEEVKGRLSFLRKCVISAARATKILSNSPINIHSSTTLQMPCCCTVCILADNTSAGLGSREQPPKKTENGTNESEKKMWKRTNEC